MQWQFESSRPCCSHPVEWIVLVPIRALPLGRQAHNASPLHQVYLLHVNFHGVCKHVVILAEVQA